MQIRCWKRHRRIRPRPLVRPDAGLRDCLAVAVHQVIGIWVVEAYPAGSFRMGGKERRN